MTERLPDETRDPLEGFETAIVAARAGELTFENLIGLLAETTLVVPSVQDFRLGGDKFQPLTFPFEDGDGFVMGVFTAQDRTDAFDEIAPYATALTGRQILGGLQPGAGLVINPGSSLGFQIEPTAVPGIVAALDKVLADELEAAMPEREPSELERAITALESGKGGAASVLSIFERTAVTVPTRADITESLSELDPIVLDFEGNPMLAVFTGTDLIGDFAEHAQFALSINGGAMAEALSAGTGIVINPNRPLTFVITPEQVEGLHPDL